jgi:hypothetical protein
MKPTKLKRWHLNPALSPAQIEENYRKLGPIARRWGRFPKGTTLPETQIVVSPRVPMAEFAPGWIPKDLYERNLEQNQLIKSCCRHPEHHTIEARKSHPDEQVPDVYRFHCEDCGAVHHILCTGPGFRPEWEGDDPQWPAEKAAQEAKVRDSIAEFHQRMKAQKVA